MSQPFAALLVRGVETLETRRTPFLAAAPPNEWLALPIGETISTSLPPPATTAAATTTTADGDAPLPRGHVVALVCFSSHRRLDAAARESPELLRRACLGSGRGRAALPCPRI